MPPYMVLPSLLWAPRPSPEPSISSRRTSSSALPDRLGVLRQTSQQVVGGRVWLRGRPPSTSRAQLPVPPPPRSWRHIPLLPARGDPAPLPASPSKARAARLLTHLLPVRLWRKGTAAAIIMLPAWSRLPLGTPPPLPPPCVPMPPPSTRAMPQPSACLRGSPRPRPRRRRRHRRRRPTPASAAAAARAAANRTMPKSSRPRPPPPHGRWWQAVRLARRGRGGNRALPLALVPAPTRIRASLLRSRLRALSRSLALAEPCRRSCPPRPWPPPLLLLHWTRTSESGRRRGRRAVMATFTTATADDGEDCTPVAARPG